MPPVLKSGAVVTLQFVELRHRVHASVLGCLLRLSRKKSTAQKSQLVEPAGAVVPTAQGEQACREAE